MIGFFFFEQKTSYEMRISDWSSDVCSSDLVQTYALDVTDAPQLEAAIRDFQPDALVCSAAILGRGAIWDELTPARFAEVMAINVGGTFNACRAVMRDRKSTRLNSSH